MNQQDWYSELLTPGLEVLPRLNELHQAHLEIGVFLLPGKIQSQVLFLSSAVKATEPLPALCEASLVLSAPRADFQWIPASSLVFHGKLASALMQTSHWMFDPFLELQHPYSDQLSRSIPPF